MKDLTIVVLGFIGIFLWFYSWHLASNLRDYSPKACYKILTINTIGLLILLTLKFI